MKSFGYKVKRARRELETKRGEQERERDRRERKEQDTTTYTKGGQAQQSVANSHFIFVMLTVPLFMPTRRGARNRGEGENVFTLTRTFCRVPFCVLFLFFLSLPLTLFRNNTLEWRTILLLTPPSTQFPCKVHANKASSPSSSPQSLFFCNSFTFKSIILLNAKVKRLASHGHDFLEQVRRNSGDLLAAGVLP